jgi:hypothetical protein
MRRVLTGAVSLAHFQFPFCSLLLYLQPFPNAVRLRPVWASVQVVLTASGSFPEAWVTCQRMFVFVPENVALPASHLLESLRSSWTGVTVGYKIVTMVGYNADRNLLTFRSDVMATSLVSKCKSSKERLGRAIAQAVSR